MHEKYPTVECLIEEGSLRVSWSEEGMLSADWRMPISYDDGSVSYVPHPLMIRDNRVTGEVAAPGWRFLVDEIGLDLTEAINEYAYSLLEIS